MSTPHPDAAPTPGADQTVRLGPGTGEGEETRHPAPGTAGEAGTVRLSRADVETTVRLDGAPDPRADGTVRLARSPLGAADPEATVRLDKAPDPRADRTVRLSPAGLGAPDPEATARLDAAEVESATFLDPRVWGAPRSGEGVTLPEPLPAPAPNAGAPEASASVP
ncbi:hypothetical protein ACFQ87_43545, partial [Kitasatospora sp. NPDC056531]